MCDSNNPEVSLSDIRVCMQYFVFSLTLKLSSNMRMCKVQQYFRHNKNLKCYWHGNIFLPNCPWSPVWKWSVYGVSKWNLPQFIVCFRDQKHIITTQVSDQNFLTLIFPNDLFLSSLSILLKISTHPSVSRGLQKELMHSVCLRQKCWNQPVFG